MSDYDREECRRVCCNKFGTPHRDLCTFYKNVYCTTISRRDLRGDVTHECRIHQTMKTADYCGGMTVTRGGNGKYPNLDSRPDCVMCGVRSINMGTGMIKINGLVDTSPINRGWDENVKRTVIEGYIPDLDLSTVVLRALPNNATVGNLEIAGHTHWIVFCSKTHEYVLVPATYGPFKQSLGCHRGHSSVPLKRFVRQSQTATAPRIADEEEEAEEDLE